MIIRWLLERLIILIQFIIGLPKIIFLGLNTLIERIKNKWYKMPHATGDNAVQLICGKFGQGKNVLSTIRLHSYLERKKYRDCDVKVLSNVNLNLVEFPTLNKNNYHSFTNIDDIDWFFEENKNPKKNRKFNHDCCFLIIDEINSIFSNRDFMMSKGKNGKASMNKNFIISLRQLRKLNCFLICMSQDASGMDIVLRRLFQVISVPHLYFFNRIMIEKQYDARSFSNYLDSVNAPPPRPIGIRMYIVNNKIFNSYDTHELVKALQSSNYFTEGDTDRPIGLGQQNTSPVSVPNSNKNTIFSKLISNKQI